MNTFITTLGLSATAISIISFLPQVIQCWKTKHTKDISLHSYVLLITGAVLWFVYGLLSNQFPVILANVVVGLLELSIIFLKLKYG